MRELGKAFETGGEGAGATRRRLSRIANNFLRPGCATEINVKGCSRGAALEAIALAEKGCGSPSGCCEPGKDGVDCEKMMEYILLATEALVDAAREVHVLILHDLWPRFLASPEFSILMLTKVCPSLRYLEFEDDMKIREGCPVADSVPYSDQTVCAIRVGDVRKIQPSSGIAVFAAIPRSPKPFVGEADGNGSSKRASDSSRCCAATPEIRCQHVLFDFPDVKFGPLAALVVTRYSRSEE